MVNILLSCLFLSYGFCFWSNLYIDFWYVTFAESKSTSKHREDHYQHLQRNHFLIFIGKAQSSLHFLHTLLYFVLQLLHTLGHLSSDQLYMHPQEIPHQSLQAKLLALFSAHHPHTEYVKNFIFGISPFEYITQVFLYCWFYWHFKRYYSMSMKLFWMCQFKFIYSDNIPENSLS